MRKYAITANYKHYIYLIDFPDGSFYIGCSYHLAIRLHQHELSSNHAGNNFAIHNKMREYPNYDLRILAVLPNRKIGRDFEVKLIESLIHRPGMLNRVSPTLSKYKLIKSHKDRGNNYDKERFENLTKIIGFAS